MSRCAGARRGEGQAQASRWLQRGPLKPGEMQMGTPEWMKNRPEHKHVID
jgi:hypothetical protein